MSKKPAKKAKKTITKTYSKKVWAVVTKAGRVQLDTICYEKESTENFLSLFDEAMSSQVRRVTVTCEWTQ